MKLKKILTVSLFLILFTYAAARIFFHYYPKSKWVPNSKMVIGDKVDSLNGVYVFYNGKVGNVTARNTTADGYNLGLEYQCVEFVKRYYYEHFNHKMPNSYGHAKDFYNKSIPDGQKNVDRNLIQYSNPSKSKPKVNDLVIYKATAFNKFGHVAIVSKVHNKNIEIIQQNPGPFHSSRETYTLKNKDGTWKISHDGILGWLRKE